MYNIKFLIPVTLLAAGLATVMIFLGIQEDLGWLAGIGFFFAFATMTGLTDIALVTWRLAKKNLKFFKARQFCKVFDFAEAPSNSLGVKMLQDQVNMQLSVLATEMQRLFDEQERMQNNSSGQEALFRLRRITEAQIPEAKKAYNQATELARYFGFQVEDSHKEYVDILQLV